MKMELANLERAMLIRDIVERRRIETLCHFTRVENLSSIMRLGLLGRRQLELNGIPFLRIDNERIDGYPGAVCLTISFPNYRLFYKKREEFRNWSRVEHNQWVVLLLEPRLLWELECAFCTNNAADSRVARIPLEERKKSEALKSMFGDFPTFNRPRNLPPHYPTSPQAEVLVFDTVPISYLKEVHFYDCQGWESWYNNDYTANHASIYYGNRYFERRKTY